MELDIYPWFYDISRKQAEEVLLNESDGTYLVRKSESSEHLSLSIRLPDSVKHYKIFTSNKGFYMEAIAGRSLEYFDTVEKLVSWYSVPGRGLKSTLVKPYCQDVSSENASKNSDSESDEENLLSEEDTITCFFKQQLDLLYSSLRGDLGMKDLLDQYIEKGVFKDFKKVAAGATKPVFLQQLIVQAGLELSSALSNYLRRLNLIKHIFDVGSNVQEGGGIKIQQKTGDYGEDFESLLNMMNDCQSLVLSLEEKACKVFTEYSSTTQQQNRREYKPEDIYSIVKDEQVPSPLIKKSSLIPLETITRQFEVTSGHLKSKSYILLDVKGDKIFFVKNLDEIKNSQGYSSQQVLQLSKPSSSKVKLNVLLENQNIKSYNFENYKSREVFCQNVQHMKIEYSKDPYSSKVSVFIGTWNMGDANSPEDLSQWFRCLGQGKTKPRELSNIPSDIYAIGTQESAYHDKEWVNKVSSELKKTFNQEFKTLICSSLWGIRLAIFVKPELINQVSSLKHSSVKTGIANALGNKGAVGVSFLLGNTSFCFVNCHLASRFERKNRRNQDFNSILRGLNLGQNNVFDLTLSFHHLFWFGDLNYRIDMDITDIIKSVMEKDWKNLMIHDQLNNEIKKETVFNGFDESELTFPPTYRYKRGDRTCYIWIKEKRRGNLTNVPSWCDRVLWKSFPELTSCNTTYGCPVSICSSDHSPVFATFDVDILTHATPVNHTLEGGKSKPVKIKLINIEGQIQTSSSGSFVIEFHSTSFENPYISKKNSMFNQERRFDSLFRKTNLGSESIHKYPFWASGDLPEMLPIISDVNYLQDQYLLMAVKGDDGHEFYGECVYSLKQFLTGELQEFSCPLMHLGEYTGKLKIKLQMKLPGDYIYQPPLKSNKIYDLICTEDDFGNLPELETPKPNRLTKLIPIDKPLDMSSTNEKMASANEKMAFDNPCIQYPQKPYAKLAAVEAPELPPKKSLSRHSSRESISSSLSNQSLGSGDIRIEKERELQKLLDWLKKINQQQYFDQLVANGYDNLDYFPSMTKKDLIDVGIKKAEDINDILTQAVKIKSVSLKGMVRV